MIHTMGSVSVGTDSVEGSAISALQDTTTFLIVNVSKGKALLVYVCIVVLSVKKTQTIQ